MQRAERTSTPQSPRPPASDAARASDGQDPSVFEGPRSSLDAAYGTALDTRHGQVQSWPFPLSDMTYVCPPETDLNSYWQYLQPVHAPGNPPSYSPPAAAEATWPTHAVYDPYTHYHDTDGPGELAKSLSLPIAEPFAPLTAAEATVVPIDSHGPASVHAASPYSQPHVQPHPMEPPNNRDRHPGPSVSTAVGTAGSRPARRAVVASNITGPRKAQSGVKAARSITKASTSMAKVTRPVRSAQGSEGDAESAACWRCRRYKKQCNGPGECSNCMKGNFRVWPESLGCRRDCMEDLATQLVPDHTPLVLASAAGQGPLGRSWRARPHPSQRNMIAALLPSCDRLQRLSLKVQSIGMFGPELASLFNIIAGYQAFHHRSNAALDASIETLDATCDVYFNFIENDWPLAPRDVSSAATMCQWAFHRLCKSFIASALSSRREDWLPSFLCMCLGINSAVIMLDATFALPSQWRLLLYANIYDTVQSLRENFLPLISDLLRAGTSGSRPFEMHCWTRVPDPVTGNLVRNPAGMRLVAHDEPTFDAMLALQAWYRQNGNILALGPEWKQARPFSNAQAPPITAMLGLFKG